MCLYLQLDRFRDYITREDRASNLLLAMMKTSRSWRGLLGAGG
jgi:hypothetical protein